MHKHCYIMVLLLSCALNACSHDSDKNRLDMLDTYCKVGLRSEVSIIDNIRLEKGETFERTYYDAAGNKKGHSRSGPVKTAQILSSWQGPETRSAMPGTERIVIQAGDKSIDITLNVKSGERYLVLISDHDIPFMAFRNYLTVNKSDGLQAAVIDQGGVQNLTEQSLCEPSASLPAPRSARPMNS